MPPANCAIVTNRMVLICETHATSQPNRAETERAGVGLLAVVVKQKVEEEEEEEGAPLLIKE